jgi:hypothetical protein
MFKEYYKGYCIIEGMTIYAQYEFYKEDDDEFIVGHSDTIEGCKEQIDKLIA